MERRLSEIASGLRCSIATGVPYATSQRCVDLRRNREMVDRLAIRAREPLEGPPLGSFHSWVISKLPLPPESWTASDQLSRRLLSIDSALAGRPAVAQIDRTAIRLQKSPSLIEACLRERRPTVAVAVLVSAICVNWHAECIAPISHAGLAKSRKRRRAKNHIRRRVDALVSASPLRRIGLSPVGFF